MEEQDAQTFTFSRLLTSATSVQPETANLGMCSEKLKPGQRPSLVEIFVPPVLLVLIIPTAFFGLVLHDKFNAWRRKVKSRRIKYSIFGALTSGLPGFAANERRKQQISIAAIPEPKCIDDILHDSEFYSDFDREVLHTAKTFYNKPMALVRITIPAMVSLFCATLLLVSYDAITACMWPGQNKPNVNSAVTSFLAPAGLVYALSFGFMYQTTLEKQSEILRKVSYEFSLLDQILTMTVKLNLPTRKHVMAIYKAVKSECIFTVLQVQNREPSSFKNEAPDNIKVHLWSILDVLRDAETHAETKFNLNRTLGKKIVGYMTELNNICSDRMGSLHSNIHPVTWIFLEILSIFSLFGVCLISASSSRMELAMSELTIFSSSMLCYVLADLDSPFNGFFRIDLAVLPDVIKRCERMYDMVKHGEEMEIVYPQK